MQGARGWCRWCCRAPGNEPYDSPLPNEKIRHLPEAVRLSSTAPLCRSPRPIASTLSTLSTYSTSTVSTSGRSSPENSATYGAAGLERVLPLLVARAKGNVEDHHSRYSRAATVGAGGQAG